MERLIKECFWEYNFSPKELADMLKNGSLEDQVFVFGKILANSTDLLHDMEIFNLTTLKELIDGFDIPRFNHDFLFRRKNILEHFFLDRPIVIEELKWPA